MPKGAFTPKGFPGQKSMSKSHMPVKGKDYSTKSQMSGKAYTTEGFPGKACINPAHGLTKNTSPIKGMINTENNRVGSSTRGFSSTIKQGPFPIGGKK